MARLQDFPTVTPTSSDKLLVVQSQGQGLVPYGSKLDSANPTGTGKLSLNRKANTTEGSNSATLGSSNEASGAMSMSFGYSNKASGSYSTALCGGTKATGNYSFAEGDTTEASGDSSHSSGRNTIANHFCQNVFGAYNVADTSTAQSNQRGNYVEIVGNGTGVNARSNARTLDWSGNEVLAGDLTVLGSLGVAKNKVLELISSNSTKEYTIPTEIYSNGGIYLLAFGNSYGAGSVHLINISSNNNTMYITTLATSSYVTVTAVSATKFSVTTGGASFTPVLTRIA